VRGFVDALREQVKDTEIKVLAVYPGGMKTHLHDEALPADFEKFMEPSYVTGKILENLKQDNPEQDLIIKRPSA
jgi:short-subunit dehydrogenase